MLPADAADWPYYQHDAAHTGASTAIVNPSELTLAWSAPMGYSTPLIVGDTIYSTRNQGGYTGADNATLISAFEIATGAIKWTYSGDFAFPSQAAVGGGFVVFHSGSGSNNDPGQLYVLDAITGTLRYKVPGLGNLDIYIMPLLVPNPADGTVMAYCAGHYALRAVQLGATSGSILWTQQLQAGGYRSMPTLVGDSIVVAQAAFDLATGAQNRFHFGHHNSIAYDSTRRHIYLGTYDGLIAYRYLSNAQIEFLWEHSGPGTGYGTVAIGPDGKLYAAGQSLLIEVDPNTGSTLRSGPGTFDSFLTPSITAGMIWTNSGSETMAYDMQTLQLVRTFPWSNFNTEYSSPGAFTDGYFVLDRGGVIVGRPGFQVYAGPAAQALNLSTRMRVQTGENVGIGGFIITGSVPKHVLLRAIGPSLTQFGIPDALADPGMELHGPGGFVTITNNDWRDDQEVEIAATGIPPAHDFESAIVATLDPGAYTAIVRGTGNTSGTALVEVYDLNQPVTGKLANISTRAFVGTGTEIVIAGFILGGNTGPGRIVARGIGPSLTATGVPDALADPTLELRDSNGTLLVYNNDWQDNQAQAAELTAAGLAPTNNLEAAIAATLPPGLYTALLAGLNTGTGVGLVEVYDRGAP